MQQLHPLKLLVTSYVHKVQYHNLPTKDTLLDPFPIVLKLREKDNLSTEDKMAAKVSFIWRYHCTCTTILIQ